MLIEVNDDLYEGNKLIWIPNYWQIQLKFSIFFNKFFKKVMAPSINLKELQDLIRQRSLQGRSLVALAGPPGSGKSTLATELETALNQEQPEQAMILPMDGFHYDDPTSRCYRGEDAELWFDLTCTHPNPKGHRVISDMIMSVVRE